MRTLGREHTVRNETLPTVIGNLDRLKYEFNGIDLWTGRRNIGTCSVRRDERVGEFDGMVEYRKTTRIGDKEIHNYHRQDFIGCHGIEELQGCRAPGLLDSDGFMNTFAGGLAGGSIPRTDHLLL